MYILYTFFFPQLLDYDLNKYKNVKRWFTKMKSEIPKYEEINGEGLKAFKTLIDSLKKKK